MAAQASDEGLRITFAERSMRPVALTFVRPAGAIGQLGVGRRLVNEDQARQGLGEEALAPPALHLARPTNVGALLLAGLNLEARRTRHALAARTDTAWAVQSALPQLSSFT